MKYFILAISMMVTTAATAEEGLTVEKSRCASVSEFSQFVMTSRQFYKPMSELMEQTDNEYARFIIMDAYDWPIYEETHEKLESISDFASHYSGECYKAEMKAAHN